MRMLLLATLVIFASSASAGLYKWVDDEGNVHYSQKRPQDQKYKRLKPPSPTPEDTKPLYQSTSNKTKTSDVVATETAKNEKIRADNCAAAKKNLNSYTLYRRIKDKDGNVSYVDDKVRAQNIEKAKNAIAEFCQ